MRSVRAFVVSSSVCVRKVYKLQLGTCPSMFHGYIRKSSGIYVKNLNSLCQSVVSLVCYTCTYSYFHVNLRVLTNITEHTIVSGQHYRVITSLYFFIPDVYIVYIHLLHVAAL